MYKMNLSNSSGIWGVVLRGPSPDIIMKVGNPSGGLPVVTEQCVIFTLMLFVNSKYRIHKML